MQTRSTRREPGAEPVSVVDRVFTLLAAFGPADSVLTLAELSRRAGLPKPTVHRLIAQLSAHQVLETTPDGIRVGMGLFELGQLAAAQRSLRDAAAPFLTDLHEATGFTVHLAVGDGHEVVYVQKLESRRSPTVGSRVGGRMPAYCTAVGKALLAHGPADVVHGILAGRLPRRTPRTLVAPGLLDAELRRVAATGTAEEHEESGVGIACVAAPVLTAPRSAVAAVSVTGPVQRIDTGRLAPAVRRAALGISRSLHDRRTNP